MSSHLIKIIFINYFSFFYCKYINFVIYCLCLFLSNYVLEEFMLTECAKILISENDIKAKIKEVAAQISNDYQGEEILFVGILKGCIHFYSDLTREITVPSTMDFMAISSYGSGTTSSGEVKLLKDLDKSICGKNVVIIDERNEIAAKKQQNAFNLGSTVDVLTFCDKEYGFTHALRTLNPDVIITDELSSVADVSSVINAIYGGVNVVATMHASSLHDALNRGFTGQIKAQTPFDYYVLINESGGERYFTYYDINFNTICLQ